MSTNVFSAARYLCEASEWTLSNLKLQKILYLAHMEHLGRFKTPMIEEGFEAWDYGPVSPQLYRQAKAFGNDPVRNVFHGYPALPDGTAAEVLDEIYSQVGRSTAGQLVRITHRKNGAWDKIYVPGVPGIRIPDGLILQEYQEIQSKRDA